MDLFWAHFHLRFTHVLAVGYQCLVLSIDISTDPIGWERMWRVGYSSLHNYQVKSNDQCDFSLIAKDYKAGLKANLRPVGVCAS